MNKKFSLDSIHTASSRDELAEAYGRAASDYDEHVVDEIGWTGHDVIADVASRHIPRDARLLDAGAGTGLSGAALVDAGFRGFDGFDISDGMLDIARKRNIYRELLIGVLGEQLPFSTDSYDGVIACGVFLGNHAPPRGFEELIRVTRPGGHVLLTLRAGADPAVTAQYSTQDYRDAMATHEAQRQWRLIELTPPQVMLASAEDSRHQVWVFEVLGEAKD